MEQTCTHLRYIFNLKNKLKNVEVESGRGWCFVFFFKSEARGGSKNFQQI